MIITLYHITLHTQKFCCHSIINVVLEFSFGLIIIFFLKQIEFIQEVHKTAGTNCSEENPSSKLNYNK